MYNIPHVFQQENRTKDFRKGAKNCLIITCISAESRSEGWQKESERWRKGNEKLSNYHLYFS